MQPRSKLAPVHSSSAARLGAFLACALAVLLIPGLGTPARDVTAAERVSAGRGDPRPTGVGLPRMPAPHPSAQERSPLQPRDIPPDGVDLQLTSFDPAGSAGVQCRIEASGLWEPDAWDRSGVPCVVEITDTLELFLQDFYESGPTDVAVTDPQGRVEQGSFSQHVFWLATPGRPLGTYQVRVSQGSRVQFGTFSLILKDEPSVKVGPTTSVECAMCGNPIAPGADMMIAMAGFGPHAKVPTHIYQRLEDFTADSGLAAGKYRYVNTLGLAEMNARGEALYILRTSPSDPIGSYLLLTDPPVEPLYTARFDVYQP